jgi:hypothetical protein
MLEFTDISRPANGFFEEILGLAGDPGRGADFAGGSGSSDEQN